MGIFGNIALLLIAVMFGGALMDISTHHTYRNQLQSVTDSAALAGASMLYGSTGNLTPVERQGDATAASEDFAAANLLQLEEYDPQGTVTIGYYDADANTFSTTPSTDPLTEITGGYNAVHMEMTVNNLPTLFANLLGISGLAATQVSVAYSVPALPPLWPFVTCQGQLDEAELDGDITNDAIRNYKKDFYVNSTKITNNCPGQGQWGFYNFMFPEQQFPTDEQVTDWIINGYNTRFIANDSIFAQNKPFIKGTAVKNALDDLIAAGEPIDIPLIDGTFINRSSGNAEGHVTKVAHFLVTDYHATGPKNFHYIEGHFMTVGPMPTQKPTAKLVRPQ